MLIHITILSNRIIFWFDSNNNTILKASLNISCGISRDLGIKSRLKQDSQQFLNN